MKKTITCLLAALAMLAMSGCGGGRDNDPTTREWAILRLQNGEVVEGWTNDSSFHSGQYVKLEINGIMYHTHRTNVTLIDKPIWED